MGKRRNSKNFDASAAIFSRLNDATVISDLRIKHEDECEIVFGVKRSKYLIRIPKQITPEIAYLAGAIAGDGCLYLCKFKNRIYPRVRVAITGGDKSYLDLLNSIFTQTFGAGGHIHKDTRKQSCYNLLINHRIIWLYFKNILDLDKKRLAVPESVANRLLFRFFLAGFFDTDGYASRGIFGTMMGGKNSDFLRQFVSLSARLYSLEFSPVKANLLVTNHETFKRVYTRLKKSESAKFVSIVPLRNKKYGLAQIRTGGFRCVRATC